MVIIDDCTNRFPAGPNCFAEPEVGILAFTVGVVEVARIIWSNRIHAAMALLGRLYLRQARRAFSGAAAARNQVAVVSTEPAPVVAAAHCRLVV